MAVFRASSPDTAVGMFDLFMFAPPFGAPIGSIDVVPNGGSSTAMVNRGDLDRALAYVGARFDVNGTKPVGGTYTQVTLLHGDVAIAVVDDLDAPLKFRDIATRNGFLLLAGDDDITGSNRRDVLFTGDGGNDAVRALKGDDSIYVSVADGQPVHKIDGGRGKDRLIVDINTFSDTDRLDLRKSVLRKIEILSIGSEFRVVIEAGAFADGRIAPDADLFGSGGLRVVLEDPGRIDLSRLKVGSNPDIVLEGSHGSDRIAGSDVGDVIRGGRGADRMGGGAGNDRFDFDDAAEIGKKPGTQDIVDDFAKGDRLDFSNIDADSTRTGNQDFAFLRTEGAAFTKAGQVAFQHKPGVTLVRGDTDGDGKADFILKVAGKIDVEPADFVL